MNESVGGQDEVATVLSPSVPHVPEPPPAEDRQAQINSALWSSGNFLRTYDNVNLKPAEVLILARYREAIAGRVLDVGCGGGRILGYLLLLGADAHGVDISPKMVEHCRRRFPGVDVRVADLADLTSTVEAPFDIVLMSDDVLDVFDGEQRRQALADVRQLLGPGGLLIFSSHNLDHRDHAEGRSARLTDLVGAVVRHSPAEWAQKALDTVAGRRNRRRLAPLQHREADHAVINDSAHQYGLLHYYIGRADQERQLSALGFTLLDVLEADGPSVSPGERGRSSSLYYVATALVLV